MLNSLHKREDFFKVFILQYRLDRTFLNFKHIFNNFFLASILNGFTQFAIQFLNVSLIKSFFVVKPCFLILYFFGLVC